MEELKKKLDAGAQTYASTDATEPEPEPEPEPRGDLRELADLVAEFAGLEPLVAGPVVCDDSSGDDDEAGIVKVKFGAEDQGPLGINFKEISIKSC
jgi:hypothetical protein